MFAEKTVDSCNVDYLDCRGYYDLAAEMIGLILAVLIAYRSLVNFRQLRQQKSNDEEDTQFQHNLRRKIRINLINIIFLTLLIAHIIFSMILFQMTSEQNYQDITQNQLQKWYRSTQIMFAELLNLLLLAIGLLHWHGFYFFFRVKERDPPLPFSNLTKYAIYFSMGYCVATLLIGIAFVFQDSDENLFLSNLFFLISSAVSIIFFVFFRLAYYKHIFRSIRLGKKAVSRQKIFNLLIIASSLARITVYFLQMNGFTIDSLRKYNSDCYDVLPFHSIFLLFITAFIDLLPSFIFSIVFTTLQRQRRRHKSQSDQTLFSAQPSEFVSGIIQQ